MHKFMLIAACGLSLAACGVHQEAEPSAEVQIEEAQDDLRRNMLSMLDAYIVHTDTSIAFLRDSNQAGSELMQRACDHRYVLSARHMEYQRELGIEVRVPNPTHVYEPVCGPHSEVMSEEDFQRRYPEAV